MEKIIFRQKQLIDREEERKFIIDWFKKVPDEILWIYGPKNTGKTTIIEYLSKSELSLKYNINYVNLKYKKNIDELFQTFFLLKDKIIIQEIKERNIDLFDTLFNQLKNSKKKNILIFDEIQSLEEIYIDKERELLKEFLNFCARLTKEAHLAHVVLLSSNTIFINKIYNNSKLKATSQFYKVNHLKKEIVFEYFSDKFNNEELELLWEYVGGAIFFIQKVIRKMEMENKTLPETLHRMALDAKSEVVLKLRNKTEEEVQTFIKIKDKILENGYLELEDLITDKMMNTLIDEFCEAEILFFEPMDNRVYPNSKIYQKGFELLKLGR